MKIVNSEIAMASSHSLVEQDASREHLKMWDKNGTTEITNESASLKTEQSTAGAYALSLSGDAQEWLQKLKDEDDEEKKSNKTKKGLNKAVEGADDASSSGGIGSQAVDLNNVKLDILKQMLERMTGHKMQDNRLEISADKKKKKEDDMESLTLKVLKKDGDAAAAQGQTGVQVQGNQGWGVTYESFSSHSEKESVSFESAGKVQLADGREINFSVNLSMSRELYEEKSVSFRAGDALKDPLVLNTGTGTVGLSNEKMNFDIDADGKTDTVSKLQSGSAFLALDKNNDGVINDGKELFGAVSGDGFADLAQYDDDKNGWIDENDTIYAKLKLWSTDAEGNDVLQGLKEGNVGAIALQNVSTEFAQKDGSGNLQGQLRQTGIFLKETGEVGTVQKIDLAI